MRAECKRLGVLQASTKDIMIERLLKNDRGRRILTFDLQLKPRIPLSPTKISSRDPKPPQTNHIPNQEQQTIETKPPKPPPSPNHLLNQHETPTKTPIPILTQTGQTPQKPPKPKLHETTYDKTKTTSNLTATNLTRSARKRKLSSIYNKESDSTIPKQQTPSKCGKPPCSTLTDLHVQKPLQTTNREEGQETVTVHFKPPKSPKPSNLPGLFNTDPAPDKKTKNLAPNIKPPHDTKD